MSERGVRALVASDGPPARAIVEGAYARSRHVSRALELLAIALRADAPECLGLVSSDGDGVARAVVLYGSLAGATGVCRVQLLAGNRADLPRLLRDVLDVNRDARVFICELPVDAEHTATSETLAGAGFVREGGIADYFAEGVGLDLLVLRA